MRTVLIVFGALVLAGCGTLTRLSSYGMDLSDANFSHDGRSYSASLHPKDDVILFRPAMASGFGGGVLRGATLGIAGQRSGQAEWLGVGTSFLSPVGCNVYQMVPLDESAGYWELTYRCPADVDLRALITTQRTDLRQGLPLHR